MATGGHRQAGPCQPERGQGVCVCVCVCVCARARVEFKLCLGCPGFIPAEESWVRGEAAAESPCLPAAGWRLAFSSRMVCTGSVLWPAALWRPQPVLLPDSDSSCSLGPVFVPCFLLLVTATAHLYYFTVGDWSCLFPSSPPGLDGKVHPPGGRRPWLEGPALEGAP